MFRALSLRHPLSLLTASLLFFIVCDMGIFRSGLYNWVIGTNSPMGVAVHMRELEQKRVPSPDKKEVFLVGNSKTGWAFSMKLYDRLFALSPYRILQGSIDNTELATWYYLLKSIDPQHSRYAAVIIPISGYKIEGGTLNYGDDYSCTEITAPLIELKEWPAYIKTFSNPLSRHKAEIIGLFRSHNYVLDLQDFLFHPLQRMRDINELNEAGSVWQRSYDWGGKPESVEQLALDPSGQTIITYPDYFLSWEHREADSLFVPVSPKQAEENTRVNTAYTAGWIGRIIQMYQGSQTKLIFLQIPRYPVHAPAHPVLANAPDIRGIFQRTANVYFLDEDAFDDLEQPRYFHDMKHLDIEGRQIFTTRLGERIQKILGKQ